MASIHPIPFEEMCYEVDGHTPMVHLGSVEACIIHTSFYKWTSCFGISHGVHKMFYVLFHLRIIESFPYNHMWFTTHDALPWAHHAPLA
jgi:hypothetical protein